MDPARGMAKTTFTHSAMQNIRTSRSSICACTTAFLIKLQNRDERDSRNSSIESNRFIITVSAAVPRDEFGCVTENDTNADAAFSLKDRKFGSHVLYSNAHYSDRATNHSQGGRRGENADNARDRLRRR